jgi:hypothetical protein
MVYKRNKLEQGDPIPLRIASLRDGGAEETPNWTHRRSTREGEGMSSRVRMYFERGT